MPFVPCWLLIVQRVRSRVNGWTFFAHANQNMTRALFVQKWEPIWTAGTRDFIMQNETTALSRKRDSSRDNMNLNLASKENLTLVGLRWHHLSSPSIGIDRRVMIRNVIKTNLAMQNSSYLKSEAFCQHYLFPCSFGSLHIGFRWHLHEKSSKWHNFHRAQRLKAAGRVTRDLIIMKKMLKPIE